MFYSKSTGGFYSVEIHGVNVPDDAVEISADEHVNLMNGQGAGKRIVADKNGRPVLSEPIPPSDAELTRAKIFTLEASITPRRLREAILAIDNGWLQKVEAEMAELRKALK